MMQRKLKILFGHSFYRSGLDQWYEEIISAAPEGLIVKPFVLTLDPPSTYLPWKDLDRLWKRKDKKLMAMYQKLQDEAIECDIFINYNGINVHPEFLESLPTQNIFCCFDDPENSSNLSEPVAKSFDAVFYGNIASRFKYESWGCKKLAWLPIFSSPNDFPPFSESEELLNGERENDIVFIGEKNNYKKARLTEFKNAFPFAKCFGRSGWDEGSISHDERNQLYEHSKIGWNIHNSTGPINARLFMLAAYGVMQICDNKTGLGQIYKIGKEAIGFDTIPEAIELTKYYLAHDQERIQIAQSGYLRFWKDYHPTAIWQRINDQINDWDLLGTEKMNASLPTYTLSMHKSLKQITEEPRQLVKRVLRLSKKVSEHISGLTINRPSLNKVEKFPFDDRFYLGDKTSFYNENPEVGGVNLAKERISTGQPIEWPNIVALNWASTAIIGDAKQIVEIGSGTGAFAHYASLDPARSLDCFENDDFARNYAKERCRSSNVNFFKDYAGNLKAAYDLLVSIEVIEHVEDLRSFLNFCINLAPRAIFSTPNRLMVRPKNHIGPPDYHNHVREFSPGETYWILKLYYKDVHLFHLPDVYTPWLQPMTIATSGTLILADCRGSLQKVDQIYQNK